MPRHRKTYEAFDVATELEEVVNPKFSAPLGRKSTKYRDLLEKVEKHPDRWFVVVRFPKAGSAIHGSYEYLKPYGLVSRLNKNHGKRGFVFRVLKEGAARTVLVQYSTVITPTKATKPRIIKTKKVGAK